MKLAGQVLLYCLIGAALALLSTFIGPRSALAVYPDIMGCEQGCTVVATGWPFTYVSDYLGMSVGNTANIMEVWFAADRFLWTPFLANVGIWGWVSFSVSGAVACSMRRLRTPKDHN